MNSISNNNGTNSNIKVYIRLRPICSEKSELPIDYEFNKTEIQLRKANQTRSYCFDGIFGDQAEQSDLSEVIIDPFIQQVIEGFNCTVLAYGQTGTGKTYTIEGDYLDDINKNKEKLADTISDQLPIKAGLVPRAFYKLFNLLQADDQFKVSVIEIYNEEIFDLLSNSSESLRLFDVQKAATLKSLKEFTIQNAHDIENILRIANSKRQFASTLMNARSSRSHVIYQFTHHRKETSKNNQIIEKVGKLNLVDLAGSENSKRTGCQDLRALEAGNINRSLLTLTRVIDALIKHQKHVPFRDSNLTRILQDTLGGNSKTVLIATLSPALIDFEDSINTLTFASSVKQVKNNASANIKVLQNNYYEDKLKELEENLLLEQNKHEEEQALLKAQIEELKRNHELELKSKEENLEDIEMQLEFKDDEIQSLKRNISKLTDLINSKLVCKENNTTTETDTQPAPKKRKSTKPLLNTANNILMDKTNDEISKLVKNDINLLTKDHTIITRRVNKLKALITNQDNVFKELVKESNDKKVCTNQLEENLSSFLHQMFNMAIQDEFCLFSEHLTSNVVNKLSEDDGKELEAKFTEFSKYVNEKFEFIIETTDNTLSLNERELEKKTIALKAINEITDNLNTEIKELVTVAKRSKAKVKDMKTAIPS